MPPDPHSMPFACISCDVISVTKHNSLIFRAHDVACVKVLILSSS